MFHFAFHFAAPNFGFEEFFSPQCSSICTSWPICIKRILPHNSLCQPFGQPPIRKCLANGRGNRSKISASANRVYLSSLKVSQSSDLWRNVAHFLLDLCIWQVSIFDAAASWHAMSPSKHDNVGFLYVVCEFIVQLLSHLVRPLSWTMASCFWRRKSISSTFSKCPRHRFTMRRSRNWCGDTLKRACLTEYSPTYIAKVTSKNAKGKIKSILSADVHTLASPNRFLESRHFNQEINLLELHGLLLCLLVIGLTSSSLAFIMEHMVFNYIEWSNRPKYPYLP